MIALVEGARAAEDAERDRAEHPDRRPDADLSAGRGDAAALFALYSVRPAGTGRVPSVAVLVSLLVCLIPTTIGGLLSAIGIAGMDRVMQHNVLAMSGKAVEASGDVNTLLLDKTGTITLGQSPGGGIPPGARRDGEANWPTPRSSPAWPTRRRRAAPWWSWRRRSTACAGAKLPSTRRTFIPFSAYTRMSGVDMDGRQLRKGATDAIAAFVKEHGGDGSA